MSDIESEVKLYEKDHKRIQTTSTKLLSDVNRHLYKSKDMVNDVDRNKRNVSSFSSSFATFLDDKIKGIKNQSNNRITDIVKK